MINRPLLAILIASLSMSTVSAVDQITRLSDNVTLRGEFTSMTPQSVTIKLSSGREEVVSVADIRTLRFDQEPTLLAQAQSNERSGALDAALQKYRDVQASYNGRNKRLETDLVFLIARTLVKLSLMDPAIREEAAKAISEFRTGNKNNFRYLEATLLQASLLAVNRDSAAARALLEEVQSAPVPGYQLQAGVQLGQLLLADGNAAEALSAFDAVVSQAEGDPNSVAAYWSGLLGRASCQQQQGQLDDAIATVEQVIGLTGENDAGIAARAWVHKGDCLRLKNEPKAALLAYLHVDVLYAAASASHAECLYHLTQLWGPAGHQDRADDAAARLMAQYPNSEWATKLRQGG
jgi:tetratricopeptide (TPR) repeat protein